MVAAAEDCNGRKTRRYENIRAEVEAFFDVHDEMGSVPGGLHLEMTGAAAWWELDVRAVRFVGSAVGWQPLAC